MCFAGLEILWTVPVTSYFLYLAISGGVHPWTSWTDVHSHFSSVRFVSRSDWESSSSAFGISYALGRWIGVVCAFIFFIFFGFAQEARTNYRAVYLTVAKYIGLSAAASKPSGGPQPRGKKNDIGALVFAHTTTTNISIPIPDGEEHTANQKEDQTLQVNTTSSNAFLNADVNNCHLYPILPTLPEPVVTKS